MNRHLYVTTPVFYSTTTITFLREESLPTCLMVREGNYYDCEPYHPLSIRGYSMAKSWCKKLKRRE